MPTLYIFRGPPATGKSTRRAEMLAADPELRYVNKDELRELSPGWDERAIHEAQAALMAQYAAEGRSIIIDNTNMNTRTVDGYLAWAKQHGYTTVTVPFGHDVPFEEAVTRDLLRGLDGGRMVGRSVIYQFYVDAGLMPAPDPRPDAVMIDLDGTACDVEHRRHLVQPAEGGKRDWQAFGRAIPQDTPNAPVLLVYQALIAQRMPVIFMSGRGAEWRRETEIWLPRHGYGEYAAVVMRPFRDSRPDHVVKRELYEKYVAPFWTVRLVLDDRTSVVNEWRAMGLPCWQVAPGDF